MTTQSTADKKSRRRWFSPRFSLRMLMLLVTAAAVGSAFWWRWPVTQTTDRARGIQVLRETFTYHRGLRGELIKHGVHRETVAGEVILEEYYREGVLHGPYRKSSYGKVITGEYYAGKQHGTWEFLPSPDEIRDLTPPPMRIPLAALRSPSLTLKVHQSAKYTGSKNTGTEENGTAHFSGGIIRESSASVMNSKTIG